MQIRTYQLPSFGDAQAEEELNKFLRSHRVLQVEHHFCPDSGGYWALLVEYVDGDPKAEVPPAQRREQKDYAASLSDEEKERYERYKAVRRGIAQQHSIPAYLVFTNEELAVLSRLPVLNDETTRGLKGIAPQRMKDYIKQFYTDNNGEASGAADAPDSQS